MQKKKKKKSIRIFVSEEEIKFQLYLMKYANQLKQLEEKTKEEIIEKWNYDTQKKINRFKGDLEKDGFKDPVAQEAIKENIKYLSSLPAPIDKNEVHKNFESVRNEFIKSLEIRIKENNTATLKKDIETLDYVKNLVLTPTVSKERFGVLLLLMIKNLRTMPSFSGYSENWANDFFSNAVEKMILYLDNFDERLKSKRTGQNSKAFAYVTQICFNAFVNIINIRKKEDAFLKDTISYETHNFEGVQDMTFKQREGHITNEIKKSEIYSIKISKKDTVEGTEIIDEKIKKAWEFMETSNEIIKTNRYYQDELDELMQPGNVKEEEKTQDYYYYIDDIKSKIVPLLENTEKKTLFVQVPKDFNPQDIKYTTPKDKNIIITSRKLNEAFSDKSKEQSKKQTNKKSTTKFNGYDPESGLTEKQRLELEKMEIEEQELEDFNNEW